MLPLLLWVAGASPESSLETEQDCSGFYLEERKWQCLLNIAYNIGIFIDQGNVSFFYYIYDLGASLHDTSEKALHSHAALRIYFSAVLCGRLPAITTIQP